MAISRFLQPRILLFFCVAIAAPLVVMSGVGLARDKGVPHEHPFSAPPRLQVGASTSQLIEHAHRPGSIDGRTHPQLIPDDMAYSLVMRTICDVQTAPDAAKRSRAYVSLIGRTGGKPLTAHEQSSLLASANTFCEKAKAAEARAVAGSKDNGLASARATALSEARASLRASLGETAHAGFVAFVQNEKKMMKVIK